MHFQKLKFQLKNKRKRVKKQKQESQNHLRVKAVPTTATICMSEKEGDAITWQETAKNMLIGLIVLVVINLKNFE